MYNSCHKKRLAAVQTVSAREHIFMLQNCASECVHNRTYRTLQEACDEGAPCALGPGSGALIGRLRIQALPTNHETARTCCTCSCHKFLCVACRLTINSFENGLACTHALSRTTPPCARLVGGVVCCTRITLRALIGGRGRHAVAHQSRGGR